MKSLLKRKIAFAALAVALLGGGAVAVAASTTSHTSARQAYIDDVAKRLGVSPAAASSAMQAAAVDRVQAAVATGRLSKPRAEKLERRIREGRGPLPGAALGSGGRGGAPSAAASYLGLSRATLHSERRAGKSLAQIAQSTPGKSVAGLKEAILARVRERLAAVVTSGRITPGQADKRLARASRQIDAMLARTTLAGRGARARARSH